MGTGQARPTGMRQPGQSLAGGGNTGNNDIMGSLSTILGSLMGNRNAGINPNAPADNTGALQQLNTNNPQQNTDALRGTAAGANTYSHANNPYFVGNPYAQTANVAGQQPNPANPNPNPTPNPNPAVPVPKVKRSQQQAGNELNALLTRGLTQDEWNKLGAGIGYSGGDVDDETFEKAKAYITQNRPGMMKSIGLSAGDALAKLRPQLSRDLQGDEIEYLKKDIGLEEGLNVTPEQQTKMLETIRRLRPELLANNAVKPLPGIVNEEDPLARIS